MALPRPVLNTQVAFDATQAHTFTFTVYGSGAQITANKLTIRKQSDNSIVYQQKQTTFRFEHNVIANSLTNGNYYNATVTVFDNSGEESAESIPIQFYCYSSPKITLTNFPITAIIDNASFNFEFSYTQSENERLNSYVVNLYDSARLLISTSGTIYVEDGQPPYTGSYLFSGFENTTEYFVEITGATINGTTVTTGLVQFVVRYLNPSIYSQIELENHCREGYITVTSNMVLIEGNTNPDPPIYINNKEIDLRGNGNYVLWNQGYNINGDFTSKIWFRGANPNTTLIRFSNTSGQTITINYREGYKNIEAQNKQAYMEVYVEFLSGSKYYIFSDYLDILPDSSYYCFWLRRINNIYQTYFAIVG
ncbi:MAG TPA: hypothetical protein DCW90_19720 [Lachnospiraceae bacterium]|nr:hypothetical protein [Lachnospiraceae bacterium]